MVLWDFHGGDHLSAHLQLVKELRHGASFFYFETGDGQAVMEYARYIKGKDEINAMRCSIASTEIAMGMMQEASVAGATENDIWAILHAENIRRGSISNLVIGDVDPSIRYPEDVESYGYEGVMEPGVAMCVEAYIGAAGGAEGVKLEDQVIITENSYENLTKYLFEEKLLA